MIAHATHHAEKPLPSCGVTLAALLFPPLIAIPRGRKVSPLGADAEARNYQKREYKQKTANREQLRVSLHEKRVRIYRPAMFGQGWMSSNEIADETGVIADSVRQRMKKLIESGDVESQRMQNSTRQFRWVGK